VVEISRLGEAGGGTRKYYRSNTRAFSDDIPEESPETLAGVQFTATDELETLVETMYADHGQSAGPGVGATRDQSGFRLGPFADDVLEFPGVVEVLDLVAFDERGALD
jgi:hypothetical protein